MSSRLSIIFIEPLVAECYGPLLVQPARGRAGESMKLLTESRRHSAALSLAGNSNVTLLRHYVHHVLQLTQPPSTLRLRRLADEDSTPVRRNEHTSKHLRVGLYKHDVTETVGTVVDALPNRTLIRAAVHTRSFRIPLQGAVHVNGWIGTCRATCS